MAGGIIGGIVASVLPGVLPSITETVGKLVDRLIPDPVEAAKAKVELEQVISAREAALAAVIQQQNSEQAAINLAETQKEGWFSSAWRPTAAWVCVAAFAYQYLFAPVMTWIGAIVGAAAGISFPVPPSLQIGDLMPVLLGLLGLGGLRTVERVTGVSTGSAGPRR